jgi:hypothetical protein
MYRIEASATSSFENGDGAAVGWTTGRRKAWMLTAFPATPVLLAEGGEGFGARTFFFVPAVPTEKPSDGKSSVFMT